MRLSVGVLVLAFSGVAPGAQQRDAAAVLAEMRQVLGGDAVLDSIQTLSFNGTRNQTFNGRGHTVSQEVFLLRPDHYLSIRRDYRPSGPRPIDITYYNGLRGDEPISRTDANIEFPPEPGPNSPEAAAERHKTRILSMKQELARVALVLLGRSLSSYPLDFTYVGATQQDGRAYEVVDGRATDGYVVRLAVDATTHLPVILSWIGPAEFITTTTSIAKMRGGEVVSQSPEQVLPAPAQNPGGTARRLELSEFKPQDGVNWPRRWRESTDQSVQDLKVSRYRINPKVEVSRFEIK